MPGKVNPVIPEVVLQVGCQVDRQRHGDHDGRLAGQLRAQRPHPADRAQPAAVDPPADERRASAAREGASTASRPTTRAASARPSRRSRSPPRSTRSSATTARAEIVKEAAPVRPHAARGRAREGRRRGDARQGARPAQDRRGLVRRRRLAPRVYCITEGKPLFGPSFVAFSVPRRAAVRPIARSLHVCGAARLQPGCQRVQRTTRAPGGGGVVRLSRIASRRHHTSRNPRRVVRCAPCPAVAAAPHRRKGAREGRGGRPRGERHGREQRRRALSGALPHRKP